MATFNCDHCGTPINDEYPTNYFVTMNDTEQEWLIHVDCYPEWQWEAILDEYHDYDEQLLENLKMERDRMEKWAKAHEALVRLVADCEAKLEQEVSDAN